MTFITRLVYLVFYNYYHRQQWKIVYAGADYISSNAAQIHEILKQINAAVTILKVHQINSIHTKLII